MTRLDQKSFPSNSTPIWHPVEGVAVAAAEAAELAELACDDADAVGVVLPFDDDADDAEDGEAVGTVTLTPHACANSSKPAAIVGSNVSTQFAQVVSAAGPTPM